MKRIFAKVTALSAFICLSVVFQASGQRQILPANLVGADLKKLQNEYLKAIESGKDSLVIQYADALFYDGVITNALVMYQRADSLGLPFSPAQKRNFVHAARRLNRTSPYDQQLGYFSSGYQPKASVRKFCVNTPNEDFAPYVWNDLVFVTSSRQEVSRRNQEAYRFTQLPFLNVFAFDNDCQSMGLDFLPHDLNTNLHDGPIAIASDTSMLIITRNYQKPNEKIVQNLYLDVYHRGNGVWDNKNPFPYNDPAYSIQHPFYDDNNKILYFSSDMPGGYGGFDLYKSSWDGNAWGQPVNLGAEINSPYDEVFPSFSPEGHLIYSSNHIETHGGLDLVIFIDGERHLFPKPFNTEYDDLTITFIDENSGYFASNRNQSVFNDDIYYFTTLPTPFIVRVIDKDTGNPLSGVMVSYNAVSPKIDGNLTTNSLGEGGIHSGHEAVFPVGFILTMEGYKTKEITTDEFEFENGRWVITLELEKQPMTIEEAIPDGFFTLYFDNDHPDPASRLSKTSLRYDETYWDYKQRWPDFYERSASSREDLDNFFENVELGMYQLAFLASFLKEEFSQGRLYIIEFTSHASPLAASDYNMALSQRRFVSVENYLTSWDDGVLMTFINQDMLDYANRPFGDQLADPSISSDPRDPARSIYSVGASRERRVTLTWRRDMR